MSRTAWAANGLCDPGKSVIANRRDDLLGRAGHRHHDDRRLRPDPAHAPQQFHAVHAGHDHVGDDKIPVPGFELLQTFDAVESALEIAARVPERLLQQKMHVRVVVDDQDPLGFGHGRRGHLDFSTQTPFQSSPGGCSFICSLRST